MATNLWRPLSTDVFEPFEPGGVSWAEDPFAEMERLGAEMNRMFGRLGLADAGSCPQSPTLPWISGKTIRTSMLRRSCPAWRSAIWRSP